MFLLNAHESSARFAKAVRATAAALLLGSSLMASSHSDAPLIKQDPQANLTDVYAFVVTKYDGSGTQVLNIVVRRTGNR